MNDVRVLIADDEPLARRTLREHLSGVDWITEIHEAADGLTAIRSVDALQPDLLFLAICVEGRQHLLHASLQDLHARLEPSRFIRVHRSHVVNLSFVSAIEPRDGSRFIIVLSNGVRIPASRAGSAQMRVMKLVS